MWVLNHKNNFKQEKQSLHTTAPKVEIFIYVIYVFILLFMLSDE